MHTLKFGDQDFLGHKDAVNPWRQHPARLKLSPGSLLPGGLTEGTVLTTRERYWPRSAGVKDVVS